MPTAIRTKDVSWLEPRRERMLKEGEGRREKGEGRRER